MRNYGLYFLILVLNLGEIQSSQGAFSFQKHHVNRRALPCDKDRCKDPEIKSHPKNITLSKGKLRIRCKATGYPVPTITWKKITYDSSGGTPIDTVIDDKNRHYKINSETKGRSKSNNVVVSTLTFLQWEGDSKTIVFACVARSGDKIAQSNNAYVQYSEIIGEPDTPVPGDYRSEDKCEELPKDFVCSKYLNPKKKIYINYSKQLDIIKSMLKGIAKMLDNSHVSKNCRPYVLPFLCYYNMPYCVGEQVKPRKLCQQSCIMLSSKTGVCSKEFEKAKKDETLKAFIPSKCSTLPLKNCTNLTEELVSDNNETEKIEGGGSTNPMEGNMYASVNNNHNCYHNRGEDYFGTINMTDSRKECHRWNKVGHSFCRNPSGTHERPWCYIDASMTTYEFCPVPKCPSLDRSHTNILYTIIPCLFFALGLSFVIIGFAWRKHKQHFYQSAPNSDVQLVPRVNPKIQELNREDLCDFRLLGDGNIGRVYTADYTGSKDGQPYSACVAVKAIIEKATTKQIEDFVREAETRANFKHENVIALIGVISREEPLSLIYEYTDFADLHEYLLRHSPNYSDAHANDDCGPLEFSDLLAIATQIASGMSYLSTHAFVHKDLAARNCLVTDGGITKISDFSGLCDMYAGDYYRAPGRPPLPVRWMSPEAISHMDFTTNSDIWSYGILLWEIFSYGSRPFFGLSNYQASLHILENDLLPCPENCPKQIFAIMCECWKFETDFRPGFGDIFKRLKSMSGFPSRQPHGPIIHQYSPDMDVMDAPEMPVNPDDIPMHPREMSLHSMSSVSSRKPPCRRDIHPNSFTRSSAMSNSQGMHSSLQHSRHSSNHSVNSTNHLPGSSMHSMVHSIPPSISSMPRSVPSTMLNGHHRGAPPRSAHHSLPREGYYSLGRDKGHMIYPMHEIGHRGVMSVNSSHSLPRNQHQSTGYSSSANSYATCYPPSYPPSITGPPASSVFSRQSSSHASSKAPSIKSHESTPRGPNMQVYL